MVSCWIGTSATRVDVCSLAELNVPPIGWRIQFEKVGAGPSPEMPLIVLVGY